MNNKAIALMAVGIAINILLGTIVNLVKLPIYLDAIGTILITILIGVRAGAIVGVLSFILAGILINPVLPWFSGTQIVIALVAGVLNKKGLFNTLKGTVLSGLIIGVCAAVASAPVIAYLFGGITGNGASLVVAYLLSVGEGLMKSVVLSGLTSEPIDKTLQCLSVFWILKNLPRELKAKLQST
jgi:energy-coupling factor transport system substrate-specific component